MEHKVWSKLHDKPAPGQSPLATFGGHPRFRDAAKLGSFQIWMEQAMGQLCRLGTGGEMHSWGQILQVLASFQYSQVRSPVDEFQKYY